MSNKNISGFPASQICPRDIIRILQRVSIPQNGRIRKSSESLLSEHRGIKIARNVAVTNSSR